MTEERPGSVTPDGGPPQDLPQRFDVWQADARKLGTRESDDQGVRGWLIVIASQTEDEVLAYELVPERPTAADLWQTLTRAMREPAKGEPHRPTEVQLRQEWAGALQPYLDPIGVGCAAVELLGQVEEAIEELQSQLAGEGQRALLDVPGVTPEAVGGFFYAAALSFRQAPWRRAGERPIKVESPRFESGPWYAVLLGQRGSSSGLILYDSLEVLNRIRHGNLTGPEGTRLAAGLVVTYGKAEELPRPDAAAAAEHGWEVASPDAYPWACRMEPGLSVRPPLAWELELLEGFLRAVPVFVRTRKPHDTSPFPITMPVSSGELPLVLSWVGG